MKANLNLNKKTTTIILGVVAFLFLSITGYLLLNGNDMPPKEEIITEQKPIETKPVSNNQPTEENNDKPVQIIPLTQPLELNLEPHEPISKEETELKGLYGATIGPLYEKNWRMQLVSYKRDNKGITAKFKFGNTGSTPITLNNNSMYFRLASEGGEDIAYSKLVGGPITVNAQQIVDLTVYSPNPESVMFIVDIEGSQTSYRYFFGREFRKDNFEPSSANLYPEPINAPYSTKLFQQSGNGKFKYQPIEFKLIGNDSVGSLKKNAGQILGLLKIKIINTSDEDMVIEKFQNIDLEISSNRTVTDITSKDLELLGENAIPTIVKSKSIVEGYVPVLFSKTDNVLAISGESNLGKFAIVNIETFPFSNQLE